MVAGALLAAKVEVFGETEAVSPKWDPNSYVGEFSWLDIVDTSRWPSGMGETITRIDFP